MRHLHQDASLIDYPCAGLKHFSPDPVEIEKGFLELWEKWKPKIEVTAKNYVTPGIFETELEELVSAGRTVLVHALRTHNPARGAFSTHFYTLLHNHYNDILRAHPKEIVLLTAENPNTGEKKICEITEGLIESTVIILRADGFTQICAYIKGRNSRRAVPSKMVSVDDHEDDETAPRLHHLPAKENPGIQSVFKLLESAVPNQRLRKIAVWLFVGHTPKETRKRFGLDAFQYKRDIARLRMLLCGHFTSELGLDRR